MDRSDLLGLPGLPEQQDQRELPVHKVWSVRPGPPARQEQLVQRVRPAPQEQPAQLEPLAPPAPSAASPAMSPARPARTLSHPSAAKLRRVSPAPSTTSPQRRTPP